MKQVDEMLEDGSVEYIYTHILFFNIYIYIYIFLFIIYIYIYVYIYAFIHQHNGGTPAVLQTCTHGSRSQSCVRSIFNAYSSLAACSLHIEPSTGLNPGFFFLSFDGDEFYCTHALL